MKKKFVIMTACNARYGEFLINHWLKSLIENVNLEFIEVVILDYGLTEKQRKILKSKKVKLVKCKHDGHVVNIRFRDMLNFLNKHRYQQIISCDGGDIIFQKNIAHLFEEDKDKFRAVCEDISQIEMYSVFLKHFSPKMRKEISTKLKGKKIINAGFIVAPVGKFKALCRKMDLKIKNKNSFGPDQILLNYEFYKSGFKKLDSEFNFIPTTAKERVKIRKGVFYKGDETLISVVHNAGRKSIFRVIKRFGYGPTHNRFNVLTYHLMRFTLRMALFFNSFKRS